MSEHEETFEGEFNIFGWETSPTKTIIACSCILILGLSVFRLLYDQTKMKVHIPESAMLVLGGLVIGIIIKACGKPFEWLENALKLPAEIFLYVFVPVIIFDATYFLNKHAFFHNFLEIVTYAVIGTLISTVIVGILLIFTKVPTGFSSYEILTYSALVSAVDPVAVIAIMEAMHVNENIFNLAFGESTLNDGVAIVLFNLFKGIESLEHHNKSMPQIVGLGIAKFFVSVFGAMALAILITLCGSLITKITYKIPNIEPLVMLICALLSYTLSDMLLFSGVIGVMTCAMVELRYAEYNLQQKSIEAFQTMIHMLAQTFETLLFFDMGVQIAFQFVEATKFDMAFCFLPILYTLVARSVGTIAQTYFLNFKRKKLGEKLTWRDQLILILAGLRGGIAFSLAISWNLPAEKHAQIILSTSVLIVFTIFVYGISTRPAISCLKIKLQTHTDGGAAYAVKALSKPADFIRSYMETLLGASSKAEVVLDKIDLNMQHLFLKKQLPMDRELLADIDQLKMLQLQRQEEEAAKKERLAKIEWRARMRSSAAMNSRKRTSIQEQGDEYGLLESGSATYSAK